MFGVEVQAIPDSFERKEAKSLAESELDRQEAYMNEEALLEQVGQPAGLKG